MSGLYITRDPRLVNSFINHPAVFPHCGFGGAKIADVSSRIDDEDLAFVTDGETAMIGFHAKSAGLWEKHNLFLPTCRGRAAIEVGKSILGWFFGFSGCDLISAGTPFSNRAARWFNRQIGMASKGFGHSDQFGPVENFEVERARCR